MSTMAPGHLTESRAIFIPHAAHQSARPEGRVLTPLIIVAALALCLSIGLAVVGATWLPLAAVASIVAFVGLVVVGEYWGLLVWFTLSPWLQSFASDYLGIGTPISFDRLLFPAVFAAFLIRRLIARREPKINFVTGAMALFIATFALSLAYAYDPYKEAVALLQHYVLPFATYYVVIGCVDSQRRLRTLLTVNLINSVLLAAIGVFEHFSGVSLFTGTLTATGIYLGRAEGPFLNPGIYGAVLSSMAILSAWFAFSVRSRIHRLLGYNVVLLTPVTVFFTYTRSAWVSLALAAVIYGIVDRRLRLALALAVLVLVPTLLVTYAAVEADPELYSRVADPTNGIGRLETADLELQAFLRSPVIGNGPGIFNADNDIREGWVSHNSFLTILVDNGLLGLIVYAATLLGAVGRTVRAYRACGPNSAAKALIAASWAGISAYLATAMLLDDVYFVFPTALLWLLLALPIVARRIGGSV